MKNRSNIISRLWHGLRFRAEINDTFRLALPLMLGELSGVLMGMAGIMMIGHLGETTLAAYSIANVVFVIAMLIIWGSVRMVPTPVAEAHELRDGRRVRTLVIAGIWLSAFFLLVACPVLWIGILCFDLLGQDPEVAQLAIPYLKVIVFSMPAMILLAVLFNYADAFRYVRATMIISVIGLAIDVTLNWLLVFGKFGLPALGLRAVAINVGISHGIMVLALGIYLWNKPELRYIREARSSVGEVWEQTKSFIRLGIPSALQILVEFSAFGYGTILIGQISKTEQAAHQIAINLISVTYVTLMGVSTAGMIRVGQALAYNSRVKVWLAGTAAIVLSVVIMLLPTAAFLSFPGAIASMYIDDGKVVGIASGLLLFAGLFQMADAAQLSSISLLRSLNDILVPSIITFVAFWVIGMPIGYWLAVYQGWNAQGVWAGYLIALILQALWFMRRFYGRVQQM